METSVRYKMRERMPLNLKHEQIPRQRCGKKCIDQQCIQLAMAWTTQIRCERMNNDRREISYYTETGYPTVSRFCHQEFVSLEAYAIACIPSASLTWSCNFDNLPSTEPIISRNWISKLDARQLGLFEATYLGVSSKSDNMNRKYDHALLLQKHFLLVRCQNLMAWNQRVVHNVHQ